MSKSLEIDAHGFGGRKDLGHGWSMAAGGGEKVE